MGHRYQHHDIFGSTELDIASETQWQTTTAQPCTRDHCTPEERAVVEAAARRREVFLKYGEAYHEYDTDLDNTCDALLAARKEQG